jgi:hypothetical protein
MADTDLASSSTDVATYQEGDAAVQMSAKDFGRLSLEDLGEILRLSAKGWSQRKIAEFIGCSQPSVSYALTRMADSSAHLQALMRAKSHKALEQWADIAIPKAAERGDHRPARELLEAAHPELRPQPANSAGGGGVTINIGMPGQPIAPPVIDITPR